MRVAALYDVHGNLPALEAVLAEVDELDVDAVVVGGDVCLGPMPRAVLHRLLQLGERALFLRGNCDRELAAEPAGSGSWAERTRWTAQQLDKGQRAWLAALPGTQSVDVDGLGPVLFCHGSPRSDEEILTRISPEERVATAVADVSEEVVVCGHTHVQFDRRVAGKRLINAGSVGMPYEGDGAARWLWLEDGEPELRSTPYDAAAAGRRMLEAGWPDARSIGGALTDPVEPMVVIEIFESFARG